MSSDPDGNSTQCGGKPARPGFCPEINDTILCWPETAAGTIAYLPCSSTSLNASKECWANGTWYVNERGFTWTNYTGCVDSEKLNFFIFINDCFVFGYSVSLVALIISLGIFFKFGSLKCTRNKLHTHLFISFALNNIMWIIYYEVIVRKPEFSMSNPIICASLFIILQYFMLANYMWMFCESLHLYIALVIVFVRKEVTMKWFLAVGWGVPLIIVTIYCLYRVYVAHDTQVCWLYDTYYSKLILGIPVFISLLISLVFLVRVLCVILTIMHPNLPNPTYMVYKRAARAFLILSPLFGLQYLLMPLRPDEKHPYSHLYNYMEVILIPYQGLCVSCLFCFANQEIHTAIRDFIHPRRARFENYHYKGAIDSGGVFVVNGNSQSVNMTLLSLKRKSSSATVRL